MVENNDPYVNEHSEDEELCDPDHPDSEVCRLKILGLDGCLALVALTHRKNGTEGNKCASGEVLHSVFHGSQPVLAGLVY